VPVIVMAAMPENGCVLRHHALATIGVHIDASGSEFQDGLSGRGSPYEPSQAIVPEGVRCETLSFFTPPASVYE